MLPIIVYEPARLFSEEQNSLLDFTQQLRRAHDNDGWRPCQSEAMQE